MKKRRGNNAKWVRMPEKARTKRAKVDEIIDLPGLGSVKRYGRYIEWSSNRTSAEQQKLEQHQQEQHPKIVQEIDEQVKKCSILVSQLEPLGLLQHAYAAAFTGMLGKNSEEQIDHENCIDMRMLEYIQTLIVAISPAIEQRKHTESDWNELRSIIEKINNLLLHGWLLTESAVRQAVRHPDLAFERLRVHAIIYWLSIRGARYLIHERERVTTLLAPHDDALLRNFGVDAQAVALAIEKILHRLTKGISEAMFKIKEIHKATFFGVDTNNIEHKETDSPSDVIRELVRKTGRLDELDSAIEEVYGLALFELSELLPEKLLASLSLEPGQDATFFSEGEYCGWPLRIPPTQFKPFLKVAGKYYCFYPYFTDHFYRAIQRALKAAEPLYSDKWNKRQKSITESLPIELLKATLPGCTTYSEVYYRFKSTTQSKAEWNECDAILVLGDLLMAIEIKAGAFTYTSPANDLPAHLYSIKDLLIAPALQGDRFIQYLESAEEVPIYNSKREEIGRIRKNEFSLVVRCAVTLDQLTAVAGIFQHENTLLQGRILNPTWCISIDDLYVCRDILKTPVNFFHYLQYRLKAFEMEKLEFQDELDHIGAYIANNAYTQTVQALPANGVMLVGYRSALDRFFGEWWATNVRPVSPRQKTPTLLSSIIEALEIQRPTGFLWAGALLLSLNGSSRTALSEMVLQARNQFTSSQTHKILDIPCDNFKIVILISTEDGLDEENYKIGLEHGMALLSVSKHTEALFMRLAISLEGSIQSISCKKISIANSSPEEIGRLHAIAEKIKTQRFVKAHTAGMKWGRNDPCICGSGKKYKKCCGA